MSRRTLNLTNDELHALRLVLERLQAFRFPRPALLQALRPVLAKIRALDG